jgi:hypothetical protein
MNVEHQGRLQWIRSWRDELGVLLTRDIIGGKGVGVILKSIDIKFRVRKSYSVRLSH